MMQPHARLIHDNVMLEETMVVFEERSRGGMLLGGR